MGVINKEYLDKIEKQIVDDVFENDGKRFLTNEQAVNVLHCLKKTTTRIGKKIIWNTSKLKNICFIS